MEVRAYESALGDPWKSVDNRHLFARNPGMDRFWEETIGHELGMVENIAGKIVIYKEL